MPKRIVALPVYPRSVVYRWNAVHKESEMIGSKPSMLFVSTSERIRIIHKDLSKMSS
jgi:hypothetical protein